jgi:hypothetical protein
MNASSHASVELADGNIHYTKEDDIILKWAQAQRDTVHFV